MSVEIDLKEFAKSIELYQKAGFCEKDARIIAMSDIVRAQRHANRMAELDRRLDESRQSADKARQALSKARKPAATAPVEHREVRRRQSRPIDESTPLLSDY